MNYINTDNYIIQNRKLTHYAHKSDYLRLLFLYKYGGIYYDIDTICVKSHLPLLSKSDLIMGIQENYKNKYDLLCNAIIYCKKENLFIKSWLDLFINKFDENNWCYASMHLPSILYTNLNNTEKKNITILENTYFYSPNYNEIHNLFDNNNIDIHPNWITYHYWNSNSINYINNITNIEYIYHSNSLFSLLLKNINSIYHKTYLNNYDINNNKIIHFGEIYKITIILYNLTSFEYNKILLDIINQQNLFYLDIEIIIIDNNIYNNYNNDNNDNNDNKLYFKDLIQILKYKNIKINIIEYFDIIDKKENIAYLFTNNNHIFIINNNNLSNYKIHNYFFIEKIKIKNESEKLIYDYLKKENINVDNNYLLYVKNLFII